MGIFRKIHNIIESNPIKAFIHTIVSIIVLMVVLVLILVLRGGASKFKKFTIVPTDSMEPAIMSNSIILVEPVEFDDIQLNDIIRYDNNVLGYSVVHRVVALGDGYLFTKGDNNEGIDRNRVYSEQITGRVTEIHNEVAPKLTYIFGKLDFKNLKKTAFSIVLGFIVLAIILAALVLCIYYIFEVLVYNIFWVKHTNKMSKSIEWMNNRECADGFSTFIDKYKQRLEHSGILKRVYLAIMFRKYQSLISDEQSKHRKAQKYRDKLDKIICTE